MKRKHYFCSMINDCRKTAFDKAFNITKMKKSKILLLFLLLPVLCYGQLLGVGGQYSDGADGQFFGSMAFPVFKEKNKLNTFVSSGLDITTSGGAEMSGLNVKLIQAKTFLSEDLFNKKSFTILVGVDGGYLFDFRRGQKNGIVLTPNVYVDYKILFLKAGYDFDVSNGRNQFFVRAGVGVSFGTLKMFAKTRIW